MHLNDTSMVFVFRGLTCLLSVMTRNQPTSDVRVKSEIFVVTDAYLSSSFRIYFIAFKDLLEHKYKKSTSTCFVLFLGCRVCG